MARDFDRQVAEVQIRIAIMNEIPHSAYPPQRPWGKCVWGKGKCDQQLLCATRPRGIGSHWSA